MKKVSIVALLLCVVLVLSACGQAAAPAAPAAKATYVMKIGHGDEPTETCWKHNWCLEFGRLVEEYSNGQIEVQVYPSSQLGDEMEMFSQVGMGTLEACAGGATNFANFAPSLNFANIPYMFDDAQQARKVGAALTDWVMERTLEEANTRCVISYTIPRQLSSKEPVTCLADLKGMKVRVPQTASMLACYEAWGANPIVVAWAETFTALQQGLADAQDNPIQLLIDAKLGEVQKYVTDIEYLIQSNCFCVSQAWYQTLPEDCQKAIDRAMEELIPFTYEFADNAMEDIKKAVADMGIEFLGAPTDKEDWIELAKGTWPASYELIGNGDAAKGEEIVKMIEELKAK